MHIDLPVWANDKNGKKLVVNFNKLYNKLTNL